MWQNIVMWLDRTVQYGRTWLVYCTVHQTLPFFVNVGLACETTLALPILLQVAFLHVQSRFTGLTTSLNQIALQKETQWLSSNYAGYLRTQAFGGTSVPRPWSLNPLSSGPCMSPVFILSKVSYRILSWGEKQDNGRMIVVCESTLTHT